MRPSRIKNRGIRVEAAMAQHVCVFLGNWRFSPVIHAVIPGISITTHAVRNLLSI